MTDYGPYEIAWSGYPLHIPPVTVWRGRTAVEWLAECYGLKSSSYGVTTSIRHRELDGLEFAWAPSWDWRGDIVIRDQLPCQTEPQDEDDPDGYWMEGTRVYAVMPGGWIEAAAYLAASKRARWPDHAARRRAQGCA